MQSYGKEMTMDQTLSGDIATELIARSLSITHQNHSPFGILTMTGLRQ